MTHDKLSCDRVALSYLTDLSPRDAKWKEVKPSSMTVANAYAGTVYDKYYKRMQDCSGWLQFALVSTDTGELVHQLRSARFCRVRHCPICQWRRSLMWRSKTFRAMQRILADYPGKRFIYATLTVRNCEISHLGASLTWMNEAWQRLSQRKEFPGLGWLKTVEVTRSKDGTAHPHFHALLMVNPSYFTHGYLSQQKWVQMWRESLRVDYDPSVRVNVVKPYKQSNTDTSELQVKDSGLVKAIRYTLKYSTKPDEYLTSSVSERESTQQWLIALTEQMHNKRAIATGGIFRKYLSESDPSNLIVDEESIDTSEIQDKDTRTNYVWEDDASDYKLVA